MRAANGDSIRGQQDAAITNSQNSDKKLEPIRNRGERSAATIPVPAAAARSTRTATCARRWVSGYQPEA